MMVAQAPERRGQVMGVYTLGAGLSVAVGPLIGTLSYSTWGFQGLMWIYAALLLLNAGLCLYVTSPGDGMPADGHAEAEAEAGVAAAAESDAPVDTAGASGPALSTKS